MMLFLEWHFHDNDEISLTFQNTIPAKILCFDSYSVSGSGEVQWCFSQVKGTVDDDVTEGKFF